MNGISIVIILDKSDGADKSDETDKNKLFQRKILVPYFTTT